MTDPALVGRTDELQLLVDGIGSEESPRIYLVSGDAGIGKTRLLSEAASAVSDRLQLVWSERIEDPSAPAIYSWILALRSYLVHSGDLDLDRCLHGLNSALLNLMPEIRDHLSPKTLDSLSDDETSRFVLFDSVTRFFQRSAQNRPFVLMFDNLHLADQSSMELLEHFVQQIADFPIWLVACYRPTLKDRYSEFERIIERIKKHRSSQYIALEGLNRAEVSVLANELAKRKLPRALHESVYQRSEGNPLYIVELARMLQGVSVGPQSTELSFQVPHSLQLVILSRIGNLSRPAQQVLKLASVLGRNFSLSDLNALHTVSMGELSALLDEAQRSDIIYSLATGEFRFQHALYREVLNEELGLAERQHLHAEAAKHFSTRRSPAATFSLAYHYAKIADCGYAQKAWQVNLAASAIAEGNRAYNEAAMYAQQALDALCILGDEDFERNFSLRLKLGDLLFAAGNVETATGPLREAARLADNSKHWTAMAAAMRQFQFIAGSIGEVDDEAIRLHQKVLARIDPDDEYNFILARACFADALRLRGDYDTALSLATSVIDSAFQSSQEHTELDCFFYACWASGSVAVNPEQVEYRADKFARIIEQARQKPTSKELMQVLASRLFDMMASAREASELDAAIDEYRALAARSMNPHYLILSKNFEICRDLLRGQWLDVAKTGIRLQQDALRWEVSGLEGAFSQQMFVVQRATGNLVALAPLLDRIESEASSRELWIPGQILLNCELGKYRQARELLAHFDDLSRLPQDDIYLLSVIYLAESCLKLQDYVRLKRLFSLLEKFRSHCVTLVGTLAIGSVAGYMASYAVALGAKQSARNLFEEALQVNARMRAAPWQAHVQTDYAQFLLMGSDAGEHVTGRQHLVEAREAAEKFGLNPLLDRLDQLQQQTQIGELTPKERDVLTRVAKGASNKQIADELSVSQNTVATHIRHILQKLQVKNRVEAANLARQAAWID